MSGLNPFLLPSYMALLWEVSDRQRKQQLLMQAVEIFKNDTSLTPVIGAELEFYLSPDIPVCLDSFSASLAKHCLEKKLPSISIEKERGDGQYEIQIDHGSDILAIADALHGIYDMLADEAHAIEQKAIFSAKPFADQPGNSLHIHIGLFDEENTNTLMRVGTENHREESRVMQQSIAGLLASMPESITIFAPTEDDYSRFVPKCDAPTTVSWGGNNRTCALRIPASSWLLEPTRHIEHRVPASNADPYCTIIAILAGIHHGITNQLEPSIPKTYGDASLELYSLERFPDTAKSGRKLNKKGKIVNRFFVRCQKAI